MGKTRRQPSKKPSKRPSDSPSQVHRGGGNLLPGVKANQERDAQGKLRRRRLPPQSPRSDDEPGIPNQLALFRWVSEQPAICDDSERKQRLRNWADEHPTRFEDRLQELEHEWATTKRETGLTNPASEQESEAPFEELEESWARYQEWLDHREEFMAYRAKHTKDNVNP
jgi:hypothetical protein